MSNIKYFKVLEIIPKKEKPCFSFISSFFSEFGNFKNNPEKEKGVVLLV